MPNTRACAVALVVSVLAACGGSSSTQSAGPAAAASTPVRALPPLPQVPFPAARPMPIVEAVYRFAAEHPEILSRVPCFCGCESRGHRHNDDCFVAARDDRGRVTTWEPHGIG